MCYFEKTRKFRDPLHTRSHRRQCALYRKTTKRFITTTLLQQQDHLYFFKSYGVTLLVRFAELVLRRTVFVNRFNDLNLNKIKCQNLVNHNSIVVSDVHNGNKR